MPSECFGGLPQVRCASMLIALAGVDAFPVSTYCYSRWSGHLSFYGHCATVGSLARDGFGITVRTVAGAVYSSAGTNTHADAGCLAALRCSEYGFISKRARAWYGRRCNTNPTSYLPVNLGCLSDGQHVLLSVARQSRCIGQHSRKIYGIVGYTHAILAASSPATLIAS